MTLAGRSWQTAPGPDCTDAETASRIELAQGHGEDQESRLASSHCTPGRWARLLTCRVTSGLTHSTFKALSHARHSTQPLMLPQFSQGW